MHDLDRSAGAVRPKTVTKTKTLQGGNLASL